MSQQWIAELARNREELVAQQVTERTTAMGFLELQPGTAFGPPEAFGELDTQIDDLTSGRVVASADEPPVPLWYEDGFFVSLMVLDWRCAWLSTGVEAVRSGEDARTHEAVEALHSLSSTEAVEAFPDYDAFLDARVDPLLDGDTGGAEAYLATCLAATLADAGTS